MRYLLSFLLALACLTTSAQQLIFGSVRDGFLKTPLADARVSLLTTDSIVVQDSIKVTLRKRNGERWGTANFVIQLPKKTCTYLLRATMGGYEDAWQSLSVQETIDDPWGLDNPLELRRIQEKNLGEITVAATRLKMFYKGDTLVYDASAFRLPDGSMLDDLIRQMPGVTMNEHGEIFVNNRKVDELLLGSRTFMGGNHKVLLENLPYYTVKNIKVYEKETDRSRAVGNQPPVSALSTWTTHVTRRHRTRAARYAAFIRPSPSRFSPRRRPANSWSSSSCTSKAPLPSLTCSTIQMMPYRR